MAARFNSPPSWPAPPPGWTPPPGWQPDPAWGPLPDGWQLWIDEDAQYPAASSSQHQAPEQGRKAWYRRWWAITGAAVLALAIVGSLIDGSSTETPEPAAARSPATQDATASEQPARTTEAEPSPSPSSLSPTPSPTPSPSPPSPSPPPPPPPPPPEPQLTIGQENALRSARSYLDYTSFSRTGLIHQLEFESYSTGDATWAVDSLNVDWNEQAAKKAKEYLDYTSFSREGLVQQLVFEGFTREQADHGATAAGY